MLSEITIHVNYIVLFVSRNNLSKIFVISLYRASLKIIWIQRPINDAIKIFTSFELAEGQTVNFVVPLEYVPFLTEKDGRGIARIGMHNLFNNPIIWGFKLIL